LFLLDWYADETDETDFLEDKEGEALALLEKIGTRMTRIFRQMKTIQISVTLY
jgi:hypothetical protein